MYKSFLLLSILLPACQVLNRSRDSSQDPQPTSTPSPPSTVNSDDFLLMEHKKYAFTFTQRLPLPTVQDAPSFSKSTKYSASLQGGRIVESASIDTLQPYCVVARANQPLNATVDIPNETRVTFTYLPTVNGDNFRISFAGDQLSLTLHCESKEDKRITFTDLKSIFADYAKIEVAE